jgi:hypothetical protein
LFNVQSSGNVGIGTDSPTARLDILTNSATGNGDIDKHIRFRADNGEQRFNFKVGQSGNAANLGMYDGDEVQKVKIDTNGDSYFNGGNVGIGTTSPVEKLHVDGKAFINGQIYGGFGALTTSGTLDWNDSTNARSGNGHTLLRGNATNGPAGNEYYHPFSWEYGSYDNDGNMTQFAIPYSTNNTGMYYRSRYSGTWNDWAEIVTTTKTLPGGPYLPLSAGASYPLTGDLYLKTASNQGNLFFGTADANYKIFGGGTYGYMGYNTGGYHRFLTSGVEKMRIDSSGNVGIGTTSPSGPLHVKGSTDDVVVYIDTNNNAIGDTASIKFNDRAKVGWFDSAVYLGDNGQNKDIKLKVNTADIISLTSNTERMRITSAGNVGIGTTSPGAKLDIYDISTKTNTNPNTVEVLHNGNVSTNNIYPVAGLFTQRVSGGANSFATGLVGVADKLGDYGYVARGVQGIGKLSGNVTVNNADMQYIGVEGRIEMEGSNSVNLDDRAYSFYGTAEVDSGSHLKEYHGLYLKTPTNNGTILNKYGISQVDVNSKNYFAGNVGIATASPSHELEVGLTSAVGLTSQPAIPLMVSNDGNSVDGRVFIQVKNDAVNTASAIGAGLADDCSWCNIRNSIF